MKKVLSFQHTVSHLMCHLYEYISYMNNFVSAFRNHDKIISGHEWFIVPLLFKYVNYQYKTVLCYLKSWRMQLGI